MGTFKKYPAWTHWVKWERIVSELTMNSPCTCWVIDPLPPVSLAQAGKCTQGNPLDSAQNEPTGSGCDVHSILYAAMRLAIVHLDE